MTNGFFPDPASASATCRGVAARSGSNFVAVFRFFPVEKRTAANVLYAFARLTDDLVDAPERSDAFSTNVARRRERLDAWRFATQKTLSASTLDSALEETICDAFNRCCFQKVPNWRDFLAALIAIREMRTRFPIPLGALLALVDGMKRDLASSTRLQTLEEALDYCDKAATSIGVATSAILGTTSPLDSPDFLAAAQGCGRALQWTNFLRDVVEDSRRDRVYFPASDFAATGFDVEELRRICASGSAVESARTLFQDASTPFSRFFRLQIERTAAFYRESAPLVGFVVPESRRAMRLIRDVYWTIFDKIERAPFRVFGERVRPTFWEKIRLFLRVILDSSTA